MYVYRITYYKAILVIKKTHPFQKLVYINCSCSSFSNVNNFFNCKKMLKQNETKSTTKKSLY